MINLKLARLKQRGSKLQNVDDVYEFLAQSFSLPVMNEIVCDFDTEETQELGDFFGSLAQKWGIPFDLRLMLELTSKNMAYESDQRFASWMVMTILNEIQARGVANLPCDTLIEKLEEFLTFDAISEHLEEKDEFTQRILDEINSIPGTSWHEKLAAYTEILENEDRIHKVVNEDRQSHPA